MMLAYIGAQPTYRALNGHYLGVKPMLRGQAIFDGNAYNPDLREVAHKGAKALFLTARPASALNRRHGGKRTLPLLGMSEVEVLRLILSLTLSSVSTFRYLTRDAIASIQRLNRLPIRFHSPRMLEEVSSYSPTVGCEQWSLLVQ